MQVESNKAGCAFEIFLDNDDGDFVVVDTHDGNPNQKLRRDIPKRFREIPSKSETTLFQFVAKLRHAEERRDAEHDRIRNRASATNAKVEAAKTAMQRSITNSYWNLDAKLRDADKRREDLINRIREKAQVTSIRTETAHRNAVARTTAIDERINAALLRAANNRNAIIRDLRARLQRHRRRIERVRATYQENQGRQLMDGYWQHDRKLTDAWKRREQYVNTIREKAGSPNAKIQAIKENQINVSKEKTSKIEDKLVNAEVRRMQAHNHIKAKASDHCKKIFAVQNNLVRRKSDIGSSSFERHRRALENRENYLREVRTRQQQRKLKSERVRQTKRLMIAAN